MMIPGEVIVVDSEIELNTGRDILRMKVENHGDRPIQVGSHYHFYEVNPALIFARDQTCGYRLNITAGTAVRFEPGQARQIFLVPMTGNRAIYGFRGHVQGRLVP